MTPRAFIRLRGLMLILAATACSRTTGPGPGPTSAPVVTARSDSTLPVGTTYNLSATFADTGSNSAPWSYDVAWGDGATASGTKTSISPIIDSHVYAAEGSYTVTVTVTNKQGEHGSSSVTVTAAAPVILAAGDIGDCSRTSDNATGALLNTLEGIVMPLGDNAYVSGTPTEFTNCYDPAWGQAKQRTRPVAGNHDYYNPRPDSVKNADGYFGYFGAAAGDPAKGYYSYTLGSWLVIVLNTGTESSAFIAAGSPQEQWLRAELASHTQQCVVAMLHHPQFSTVSGRPFIRTETTPLWNALYEGGADLVVNGHDHNYQRYAPMKPDGTSDAAFGIRQITVGTGGGEGLYAFGPTVPTLEVRNNDTFGVLKLTLKNGGYDWRFLPAAGGTFTDSGSGTCHGRP